jgi:uncharacterized membrane protein
MTEESQAETRRKQARKKADGNSPPTVISPEAQQKAGEILDILNENGIDPAILMEGVIEQTVMMSHRGPLPSPDDMLNYGRVLPDLPERIVARWELEQKHRHDMNEKIFNAEKGLKAWGQILAFLALLVMLAVVVFMVYMGASGAAATLGSAIIVGVVATFVFGDRSGGGDGAKEE